jgi:ARG/rhodanese/phosphatase superfamily protein
MPTVDEMTALQELLEAIRIGESVSHGALTVVPLLAPGCAEPDWLTLTEAGDKVTIEEINEGGSVPTLRLRNRAERSVLLLDGEELVGAKQNRVLNTTVLVAAQATVTIPVSCVERGRWSYRSRGFVPSDHSLYASLRAKKMARVSESLRRGAGHLGDQAEIWKDLAAKAAFLRTSSPTGAMNDVYARYEETLRRARETLAAQPGQVGALVYLRGRWLGLDALAAPGLFARAWPRLCSGYAADALGQEPGVELRPKPEGVLALLKSMTAASASAVGLGAEHRFESKTLHGAALVVEDRVVHVMAFNGVTAR